MPKEKSVELYSRSAMIRWKAGMLGGKNPANLRLTCWNLSWSPTADHRDQSIQDQSITIMHASGFDIDHPFDGARDPESTDSIECTMSALACTTSFGFSDRYANTLLQAAKRLSSSFHP